MSKEKQNKWEEEFDGKFNWEEIFGKDSMSKKMLFNFISRIENKSFERGKEEERQERLLNLAIQMRENIHLQTLEEMEREIKENFNNQNGMTITYYDLLQTINKMKTNERYN